MTYGAIALGLFHKMGDPAGRGTTAEMWEQLQRTDADSLYKAACLRAVAVAMRTKSGGTDTERSAREDADRSMAWLKKAVAAGYEDRARIEKDADLASLRDRDDFKTPLAGLNRRPSITDSHGRRSGSGNTRSLGPE